MNNKEKYWYSFMATKEWAIFMNIARIATFILIAFICYKLVTEIETVKFLMHDPCKICMEKTGCNCFCLNLQELIK